MALWSKPLTRRSETPPQASGDARVLLGTSDYIDEKINEMHLLLPKLEGYSGVLHMENYSGEDVNFSFDVDKSENVIADEAE